MDESRESSLNEEGRNFRKEDGMKPSLLPAFLIPSLLIRVNSREFAVFKNRSAVAPSRRLGTFETAVGRSLKSIGLPLPIALSATLLFRGFSFWPLMIPGLICARRLLGKSPS